MWGRFRDWLLRSAPADEPPVTAARAVEIARERALQEGWVWRDPASAVRMRPTRKGRRLWWVRAPDNVIGQGVSVVVDATTGEILQAGVAPR